MQQRPFVQVDVFTAVPYWGNPLAVVLDGQGLSDADMQRFARWMQLSETTFVLPPTPEAAAVGADYQVRIFSTAYEMPFAGHPTLGSCHAWLQAGGVPRAGDTIVQQCKKGLVRIQRSSTPQGTRLAFAAPPLVRRAPNAEERQALAAAMGLSAAQVLDAQFLDNGAQQCGLWVDSVPTVLAAQPDVSALERLMPALGITGVGLAALHAAHTTPASDTPAITLIGRANREARAFAQSSSFSTAPAQITLRMFFLSSGLREDPVTGSFNASMGQWLIGEGYVPPQYTAMQGECVGSDGRIYIHQDATGQVWVGGDSVTCVSGSVRV